MDLDRRLARPGADVAFADTAIDGPAVVLTHGAGMDHTAFDAQADALTTAGYRVITWDLRGHGDSRLTPGTRFSATDALDDLVALVAECRVERPTLVGHSLGGNLAQDFVRVQPDRASALIVMGSAWNAGPLSRLERLTLRLAAPALALIPARVLPHVMARASAVSPPAIARTAAVFARMRKHVFLDVWAATLSLLEPDPDYRSPVPLALLRGAKDRTGNVAAAMTRWAQAEAVTEHVVAHAGHVLTWDAPATTTRVLLDVLAEVAPTCR